MVKGEQVGSSGDADKLKREAKVKKFLDEMHANKGKVIEGMRHTNIDDINILIERIMMYAKLFPDKLYNEDLLKLDDVDTLQRKLIGLRTHAQFPLDY
jgi:DNA polymerase III, alpha subunit